MYLAENTTQNHQALGFPKNYLMLIGRLFASYISFFRLNSNSKIFFLKRLFLNLTRYFYSEIIICGRREYLEAGGPADETEGYKIFWRVPNPLNGNSNLRR